VHVCVPVRVCVCVWAKVMSSECDGENSMLGIIPTVRTYIYESLFN